MEITMKEKDAISESLRAYVAKYPSQTKAAGSLKGVSVGTVSNILNGRYENISDEMFRNVASQVGGTLATTGLAGHPGNIAPALRIGEYSRDLLVSTGLHDLPAGSAYTTDLRGRLWQEYHRPCLPPGA